MAIRSSRLRKFYERRQLLQKMPNTLEVGGTQLSDFKMAKSNPFLYGAKYGENMSRDGVSIAVIGVLAVLVAMCIKRPKRTPRKSIFVRLSRALHIHVCFAVKMS